VKGTGLGLPLTRKLASLLGGTVSVTSHLGAGSTFCATIPRIFGQNAETNFADPDQFVTDRSSAPVVIIDDDPASLALVERQLEPSVYRVVAARTLGEAQDALRGTHPVAVIIEVQFSSGSGWSLLRQIKNSTETRDVPVFVLSRMDDRKQALEMGADD